MDGDIQVMAGDIQVMAGDIQVMAGVTQVMAGVTQVMVGDTQVGEEDIIPPIIRFILPIPKDTLMANADRPVQIWLETMVEEDQLPTL